MLAWFKNNRKHSKVSSPSVVQVTLEEMKQAVLRYEADMPEGINRISLMLSDGSLDTSRLTRYLGGISTRKFYLSRETYEIFEEEDRQIPYYLDLVQVAVDDYMDDKGKLPIIADSPQHQVDFSLLLREHYIKVTPPFPLYVTEQELMLTHRSKMII
ncbi:DUF3939 domain-containing protein [Paenibacillus anaericanus]|uniref:DUF3939 domain-containing protein n=1 Tax=Paenibacillus anaericanus TaxID=170367 RepID=A0A433XXJ0_9BACL|nr:DUF3939 domain-containing protein [Paenibacillus anaericanus]RUT39720.1 DUF3939 domain-containing protein [Paenibacillus anaericanus]